MFRVDIAKVQGFNTLYELQEPCSIILFYRNKRLRVDLGTGNNNKINFLVSNSQDMVDILETVYRGAIKGKTLISTGL